MIWLYMDHSAVIFVKERIPVIMSCHLNLVHTIRAIHTTGLLLYIFIFPFIEGQATFLYYPSVNVATLEGDSLVFTCTANKTSTNKRLPVIWYISDSSTETNITTNKTLSDGTMATVGSDYYSPLTLSNINRIWNGATVHCAVNAGSAQ